FGIVGALIGAGVEAGIQLATTGEITDLKAIAVAGAVGAVTGGIGGRLATQAIKGTISASKAVKTTAAVGGAANGVGVVVSNAVDGKATTITEAAVAVGYGVATVGIADLGLAAGFVVDIINGGLALRGLLGDAVEGVIR
ncbi:hypothetical protein N9F21_04135, partial [Porticoccaceae bacterium]|nr:hypothetical protein [Porticoccaceae bacterium]